MHIVGVRFWCIYLSLGELFFFLVSFGEFKIECKYWMPLTFLSLIWATLRDCISFLVFWITVTWKVKTLLENNWISELKVDRSHTSLFFFFYLLHKHIADTNSFPALETSILLLLWNCATQELLLRFKYYNGLNYFSFWSG